MNTIPLPLLDGDTLMLDNSTMEVFTTCQRAALYAIALRRRTSADRIALKFGGIAHKVLETRYLTAAYPMYEQTPEITASMVRVAEEQFAGYTPPPDDYRTLDRMVDLISKYGTTYPYESFELLRLQNGQPFVEVPFAVPLGEIHVACDYLIQPLHRDAEGRIVRNGPPEVRSLSSVKVMWIGKIDMVYRYNNGVYLLDHKTSSMATNMAEFEISHQFYGYTHAVEHLTGEQVAGVVINRMVCRKPTRTGESFTFERKLIPVQRGLVQEWRTDVLHIITDYLESLRRDYFPKHTVWCVGKFGTCQFHKVCSLGDDAHALSPQRNMMLFSGEYEENIWSPLHDGS